MPSPPTTISSPLRKISRTHEPDACAAVPAVPAAYTYEGFDHVLGLSPSQYLALQHGQGDYTCGVETRPGRFCRNGLCCAAHSFAERRAVQRSAPLSDLIVQESRSQHRFRLRQHWAKTLQNCALFWESHPSAGDTPRTCSLGSCSAKPSAAASPRPVSRAAGASRGDRHFPSLRKAFVHFLSTSATASDGVVSYLFLRLECYESVSVEVRARELQSRYAMNEREPPSAALAWSDAAFFP